MGSPGTVSDLTVTATTDTSATLSFSEVDDGSGKPASYDVRSSVSPISWGSAQSVTQGTCATPLAGTQIGAKRSCTVLALARSTRYDFQLVAFRGALNVDATCGKLSAVASGTTLSTPVDTTTPPPPPPPTGVWPDQPAAVRLLNQQPWAALSHRREHGVGALRSACVASERDDDIRQPGRVASHRGLLSLGNDARRVERRRHSLVG